MQKSDSSNNEFILSCENCSKDFEVNENFIDFIGSQTMPYSGTWEKIIRSLYAKVYTPATNFMFLLCGGVNNAKKEVLEHLEIKDNQKILETGIGAGENIYLLNKKANNLEFHGNDIQNQMLVHSIKNLKKWNIKANLYKSDALYLPFKDESFDVVFHLGSINLFPDKKRAIDEMIRVAKPGTKIVIADESQKAAKLLNFFTGSNGDVDPPVSLIPKEMTDLDFKIIWRGYGYLIQFRKPIKPIKKAKNKLYKSYTNSLHLI
ncbi:methyltransferase domain-containing protein [Yeosuana sp. MJ-SS3]|uniref:Methyltransferase domain-containing protein n=1 Tax=Gilvirhabdus luticola TaxID=3079858 RepID=A0ABU3U7X9_9FLAO|nr:methyltransferase domain-containing protein [Yeosuana sp. MJ-SS3]MDU8886406.1 methyltransferase domain-containing protein [Yeosuana sp. MJ-SS3]